MSTVVSLAEYKASRPARTDPAVTCPAVVSRWSQKADPGPSERSVAHRQLMLAFLEQTRGFSGTQMAK